MDMTKRKQYLGTAEKNIKVNYPNVCSNIITVAKHAIR
jgi:hypothetical protein